MTPEDVKSLVEEHKLRVIVQPSELRVFTDEEYLSAGAEISEDLTPASLIMGVKEVPKELLLASRTYAYFSHTIKAQKSNMPMLDTLLARNIRLLDFERIVDSKGHREVAFGRFAGICGMIDYIKMLGDRFLAMGHHTPLLNVGHSHMYFTLDDAKMAIKSISTRIAKSGLPRELGPQTFVMTGASGRCAAGAMEIFDLLPHKIVTAAELKELDAAFRAGEEWNHKVVYVCPVSTSDNYALKSDVEAGTVGKTPLDIADYKANPSKYTSLFCTKYAPYAAHVVNCIYWDSNFPRLMTIRQLSALMDRADPRLIGVVDVSCDVGGSLQFLARETSIDHPWYVYNPFTGNQYENMYAKGILITAVDNWPTELPLSASREFSRALVKYVPILARSDGTLPYDQQADLPPSLSGAVITDHGALTPSYKYIEQLRKVAQASRDKHVLLFGAGFVAEPFVEHMLRTPNNDITIADVNFAGAQKLAAKFPKRCTAVHMDTRNVEQLEGAVSSHDIVVCLIPAAFVPPVIEACIKFKKNIITASYKASFEPYHERILEAGLTMMNEVGLDPGIDHLTALNIIDEIKTAGGKVDSFVSWAGGLPAPECSNNPLGYKFSWNPAGALMSGHRAAQFKQAGVIRELAGWECFGQSIDVDIFPGFALEGIPNRDCLPYADAYKIDDTVTTMFRGTLRFKGFAKIMNALSALGFYSDEPREDLAPEAKPMSWRELFSKLLGIKPEEDIQSATLHRFMLNAHSKTADELLDAFEWFGFFSEEIEVDRKGNLYAALVALMSRLLVYEEGERDLVVLHHVIGAVYPDGSRKEHKSTLVAYGETNGSTAMSLTVGIPTAIATQLVMDGVITRKGVLAPMTKDVWGPMLAALKNEGFTIVDKTDPVKDDHKVKLDL